MFTNEDRENLIEYAKAHFSDLIPYDDPEYESKLQQMAEAYADTEINGIGEKDEDPFVDPFVDLFDFDKNINLVIDIWQKYYESVKNDLKKFMNR